MSNKPVFSLGRILVTLTACERLVTEDIRPALFRHQRGDWRNCTKNEVIFNEESILKDRGVFSKYHDRDGTEFYVFTWYDRSLTRVSLLEEELD